MAALLADIDAHGLDTMIARGRDDFSRRSLVNSWIATRTWTESERFLAEHRDELSAAEVRELLADSDDPVVQQHLAIIRLGDDTPLDRVFEIVTDTAVAAEAALDAVETGDLARLPLLLAVAPAVMDRQVTGAFLLAVIALMSNNTAQSGQLVQHVAENGKEIERRAHAARLRSLARQVPDFAEAAALADLLDPTAT